jgi:putative FmdB family regulatory protein
MPFYEYLCNDCGEIFEVLQPIGAYGGDLECPKCGVVGCEKLMSASAIHGTSGGLSSQGPDGCAPRGGFT